MRCGIEQENLAANDQEECAVKTGDISMRYLLLVPVIDVEEDQNST